MEAPFKIHRCIDSSLENSFSVVSFPFKNINMYIPYKIRIVQLNASSTTLLMYIKFIHVHSMFCIFLLSSVLRV